MPGLDEAAFNRFLAMTPDQLRSVFTDTIEDLVKRGVIDKQQYDVLYQNAFGVAPDSDRWAQLSGGAAGSGGEPVQPGAGQTGGSAVGGAGGGGAGDSDLDAIRGAEKEDVASTRELFNRYLATNPTYQTVAEPFKKGMENQYAGLLNAWIGDAARDPNAPAFDVALGQGLRKKTPQEWQDVVGTTMNLFQGPGESEEDYGARFGGLGKSQQTAYQIMSDEDIAKSLLGQMFGAGMNPLMRQYAPKAAERQFNRYRGQGGTAPLWQQFAQQFSRF